MRPTRAAAARPPADAPAPADARRIVLARGVVGLVRGTIADPAELAVELDEGSARSGPAAGPSGEARPLVAVMGPPPARATVVLRGPDAVGRLVAAPTPDGLAEAFLRGDLDVEGDVLAAVDASDAVDLRRLGSDGARRLLRWGWELRRGTPPAPPLRRMASIRGVRHSPARDMAAIRFHYDVGDAFFRLWLDRRLTYSCAYFEDGTGPADAANRLDAAQEAKLELISRKLRLSANRRLLDIGSGWGSLVTYAGERHAALGTGVTLSERQADEANARARAAGLGDRVRTEVRDYRDLAGLGAFDAVASVGMFEHVGRANLGVYFRAAHDALRPGGLFLNHGIAGAGPQERRLGPDLRPRTSTFVDRFVFPDSELVPVEVAVAAARAAGFEILEMQSLRAHYALTVAAWLERLEAQWAEAVAAAGEEVARTWRLYLSAARGGFERGHLDVCQLLLAKPEDGRPAGLPLRPWW